MSYALSFDSFRMYDSGEPGITVAVTLALRSVSAQVTAKIDTGSSLCVFARSVGEDLGIEIDSGNPRTLSTATGTFRVFGHNLTLRTDGIEFDSEVFFPEHEGFDRNVLGRHSWLNRVIIGINDYNGELYLSRYR